MENNIKLNPKEIFSFAFTIAKKHFFKFFVAILALIILSGISPEKVESIGAFVLWIISAIGGMYVTISVYGAAFKIIEGHEVSFGDMFAWPKNGLKMLWANILASLALVPFIFGAVAFGAASFFSGLASSGPFAFIFGILAIVLGLGVIYMSIRLMFAKYYALDTGKGPVESIKYSWNLTKNRTLRLFWLSIIMGGIVLLGLIALFIGLFWAIPTVLVAQIVIYKTLSNTLSRPKDTEIAGGTILPEVQPLELEANPSVIDVQK